MQPATLELLKDIYNHYLDTDARDCRVSFVDVTPHEKHSICNSLNYLEECGYIRYTSRALGFWDFQITVAGIRFAENGFKEPDVLPLIHGSNNIYVNGSSNSITGNYGNLSVDITNSDLPDECKQLIESFLYEMKNPHLPPEKKSEKVKSFLSDISSGTISGVTGSGLTALLVSLFNQIPL